MSVALDGSSGGDTWTRCQLGEWRKGIEEDIVVVRRFWVRKTEPWAATRRDSKREVRRVRNWDISKALTQVGELMMLPRQSLDVQKPCLRKAVSCELLVSDVGCMIQLH